MVEQSLRPVQVFAIPEHFSITRNYDELMHSPTSILIVRNTNSDSLTIFSENLDEVKRLLKMVETKMWLSSNVQKATIVNSAKFADEFIVLPIVT